MAHAGAEFWDGFFRQRRESGQTVHFFSEAYLRELLAGWRELQLDSVQIRRLETGEPLKHVWRGIAHR